MKKYNEYLVSNGGGECEYGLFVLKKGIINEATGCHPVYFYDDDHFMNLTESQLNDFVPPETLLMCKDEYGDECTGEKLKGIIEDAIHEYEQQIGPYLKYSLEFSELCKEAELDAKYDDLD